MSTTPDAIQTFAAAETATLNSLVTALNNLTTGVAALDAMIVAFQNSPETLSPADQASLDAITALSASVAAQAAAINTTPPGQPVPVVPTASK
jgi:hypothetical protein